MASAIAGTHISVPVEGHFGNRWTDFAPVFHANRIHAGNGPCRCHGHDGCHRIEQSGFCCACRSCDVSCHHALLNMTGSTTKIPSAAIKLMGLGEIRNIGVLMKDEGCATFNAIPMPVGQNPLCQGNIVRSVYLESRIASPYVFKVEGRDNLAWRITIPKEQVISLMIPDQRGGGKRSGEPAQSSQ